MATVYATAPSTAVESLNALLAILESAAHEGAHFSRVLPTLASLQVAASGIVGVKDLLRTWQVLLQRRAAASPYAEPMDIITIADWFLRLQRYLQGTLPEEERAILAQLPEQISWLPKMPAHISRELEQRLSLSPPTQTAYLEPSPISSGNAGEAFAPEAVLPHSPTGSDVSPSTAREASLVGDQNGTRSGAPEAPPNAVVTAEQLTTADAIENLETAVQEAALALFASDHPAARSEDGTTAQAEPRAYAPGESAGFVVAGDFTGTAEATTDAQIASETTTSGEAEQGIIWIGDEERQLVLTAITQELLPLAEKWTTGEPHERAHALDSLTYQCELIGNVLEHLGMHHLARGVRAVREEMLARSSNMDPEIVFACCAGLLAAIDRPSQDCAMLMATLVSSVPGVDDSWLQGLGAELARVCVGTDPAHALSRKREATEEDATLNFAPDVLASVLEGMLRELPGNTSRLGASVRAAIAERDSGYLDEARRVAHTLKGDANTVGVRGLASITHALEDILLAFEKQGDTPDSDTSSLLIDATDKIEEITDFLLGRGPHPADLLDLYQRLLDASLALEESYAGHATGPAESKPSTAAAPTVEPSQTKALGGSAPQPVIASALQPSVPSAQIRNLTLGSDVLDHLQDLAGEAMIVAQGIDRQLEGIAEQRRVQDKSARHSHELLTRLDDLVALRGAALQSTAIASGTELDPLEIDQYNELHVISRQLAEAHADVSVSLRNLRRTLSDVADLRSEQEQVNRELQRSILRTRMVPFAQIAPRLQRIVRQTAKQVMKEVELEISGENTLVDAELLERIVEPMGHLIRNAIDHGVETPELRRHAGKPDVSVLQITVGVQGDAATIDISDDGRGLDLEAIRKRATSMGLLESGTAVDERRLTRLVLLPGFSTREAATELSGRGVGMDVVNQRVTQLRGTLQLHSRPGKGLDVKIRVPITQTIANVVLVSSQRFRTAVVASSVEQIVAFAANACRFDAESQALSVSIGGDWVPAIPMESVYRAGANVNEWLASGGRGLLVRSVAGEMLLVLVRTVDEVRSVVVKPVSNFLPPIAAVRGITQLPDGTLAPVVDLDQLLLRATEHSDTERALRFVPPQETPRIVVADDSLSARRSLEQLMRDAGYEVDVASDGFEAVAQVEARRTAVLLLDMEMPRMNGLEVSRNLRNKPGSCDLPILMITSRTASKHRQMAEEAGVTQMLTKPVSEDILMTLVADLIASGADAHQKFKATS